MAESLEHVPHDTAVPVSKNTVSPPLIPADKSRFDWWQNDPLPASRVAHTLSPVLRARERPVSIWIWHDWIGSGIRTSRGATRAWAQWHYFFRRRTDYELLRDVLLPLCRTVPTGQWDTGCPGLLDVCCGICERVSPV